tara:strand:+ start:211 stop:501 length:291 start_codon:yes stop_codon:yes gene_type:complete
MKNLIKTTAIALILTATTASASSIMIGTSLDGKVITKTELVPIETSCDQAVHYANKAFTKITGQRIDMTYFDTNDGFKRYTDRVAGIDYMAICSEY